MLCTPLTSVYTTNLFSMLIYNNNYYLSSIIIIIIMIIMKFVINLFMQMCFIICTSMSKNYYNYDIVIFERIELYSATHTSIGL